MARSLPPDTVESPSAAPGLFSADIGAPADDKPAPRYKAIYQDLARAIRSGVYPVMTLLPTEHELCAHYDASRHTVREAIRMLTEAGMVSRRPGVGTRVEAAKSATRHTQRVSELADLFQYIKNATLRVLATRDIRASARLAETLGCPPRQAWLHIRAIKLLGGQRAPVAYLDAYVHPDYSAIQADIGKTRVPLLQLVEQRYSQCISEVGQEFSATPISGEMAELLKVAPHTPGLVITRRYYGENGALMLATVTTFPYTKMKYSMSLKLDWPRPAQGR
ncbi:MULTISPECIES: GntR family transcriptional regulator [Bordetella]|uniref:GntR family transcriptional regulator n=1 Tax=Bordetella petrii TaxID=94624 RepID=A0ABT7W6I5_9BORD|nr:MULTISPECIES: GntR family transcriptional regulator [Bordetella]MDM9560780.1 GntR family transcriptional regulator [Bordetella petrii]